MSLMDTRLSLRLDRYRGSSDYYCRRRGEEPTQHLRHAFFLFCKPTDGIQNNKMPPPLLIIHICPAGIDTQGGLSLRPRRHLIGGRWVRFLLLDIYCGKPIVAIPVRADVCGNSVSHRVETIGNEAPIISVCFDKILQELVILRRP